MSNRSKRSWIAAGSLLAVTVLACFAAAQEKNAQASPRVPSAATRAIRARFPDAKIASAQPEPQLLVVYRFEIQDAGKTKVVIASETGQVLSVESPIKREALPATAGKGLADVVGKGTVSDLREVETRSAVAIQRLSRPTTMYAGRFTRDGTEYEVQVSPNGTTRTRPVRPPAEQKVSRGQVPDAVVRTVLQQAGKNEVREIEKYARGQKVTYQAEWLENGQKVQVVVAPDGRLLSRKTGDENSDD